MRKCVCWRVVAFDWIKEETKQKKKTNKTHKWTHSSDIRIERSKKKDGNNGTSPNTEHRTHTLFIFFFFSFICSIVYAMHHQRKFLFFFLPLPSNDSNETQCKSNRIYSKCKNVTEIKPHFHCKLQRIWIIAFIYPFIDFIFQILIPMPKRSALTFSVDQFQWFRKWLNHTHSIDESIKRLDRIQSSFYQFTDVKCLKSLIKYIFRFYALSDKRLLFVW